MRSKPGKNVLKTRIIAIAVLAVAIFLLLLLSDHPKLVERYYSEGLYPWVCRLLHPVLNLFSFSVGDIAYIGVVCYLIYALVKVIRLLFKRLFKQLFIYLLGITIGVEAAILLFYLFWGMNYFRPSAGERLGLRDTGYTTQKLYRVASRIIDSANICRARLTDADFQQDNSTIYKTAIIAIKALSTTSANFPTYSPGIKPSLLTPLMNYLGTSGYYNPFTSETQLNYEAPYFERPVVACHEMSHQIGYGAEDEANFVGFLAGINSKDRLLRYSAYQLALDECMHALRYRDTTANNILKKRVSPTIRSDIKAQRLYWLAYRGKLETISSFFYNDFLKANNQPHGLDTYNQMVLLVVAWDRVVNGEK